MMDSAAARSRLRRLRQTLPAIGATMAPMKKATLIANIGIAVLAAGTLVYAAVDIGPRASLMSVGDYQAAIREIDNDARISSVVCKRLSGYEKSVCRAEIAAETKVRLAELDARYLGTYEAQHSARIMRIEAQYDVDKERCEAFTGEEQRALRHDRHGDAHRPDRRNQEARLTMRQFSLRARSTQILASRRRPVGAGSSGAYLNEYLKMTASRRTEMCSALRPLNSGIQLRDGR